MKHILFRGYIERKGVYRQHVVEIADTHGNATRLKPYPCFRNEHAFTWGTGKSGDTQLARAILMEVTGDAMRTLTHYNEFKKIFIEPLNRHKPWEIDEDTILYWIKQQEKINNA